MTKIDNKTDDSKGVSVHGDVNTKPVEKDPSEVNNDLIDVQISKVAQIQAENNYLPIILDDIPVDDVKWRKGIVYNSFSQGSSFILNLAKKIGWKDQRMLTN